MVITEHQDHYLSNKKKAILNVIFLIITVTGLLFTAMDLYHHGLVTNSIIQLTGTFLFLFLSLDFFIRQNIQQSAMAFGIFGLIFLIFRFVNYNVYMAPTVIWITALPPSMAWVVDRKYAWLTFFLCALSLIGCTFYIYLQGNILPVGAEQIYLLSAIIISGYLTILIAETHALHLKHIEEKLGNEKRQINQSQLASLGELAGNIAHEMNNPLQIIKGNASILNRKLDELISDDEGKPVNFKKIQKYAQNIDRTVDRTKALIDNLLQLARQPMSSSTNIETSLTEVWNLTYPLIENRLREHSANISFFNMEKKFIARPEFLSQILLNLIRNSLYEIKGHKNPWIRIEYRDTYIDVVDSGPGIDEERQEKIMTPFYSTKENHGTGLGLPLCLALMRQMGGDFIIPSHQKNTTFRLTLPKQT